MKSTSKLIIFAFTFLALAASADAQSPREQLNQMVQQLQKTPNDNALREKLIKLAQTLKPAPEISEEARRSFIIGEALFKQAKSLRPAYEAANAFETAAELAPWWSDAYWNLAVAQQFAGRYTSAKQSLRLYLLTNPSAADRRAALDRLYAIDADIITAKSSVPGGLAGFWQRSSHQSLTNGEWIKDDPESLSTDTYEIQQDGSTFGVKCMNCVSTSEGKWTVNVLSANSDAITFQKLLVTSFFDSRPIHHEPIHHKCKLEDVGLLSCTIRSGSAKLNSAISGNSWYKAGSNAVWQKGVSDGKEESIGAAHAPYPQSDVQGPRGLGRLAGR